VNLSIEYVHKDQWGKFVKKAHDSVFLQARDPDVDRSNFAVLGMCDGKPCGWSSFIELDANTIYIQYGGIFAHKRKTTATLPIYRKMHEWIDEQKKWTRVLMCVANDNIPMLKIALACGMKIIGTKAVGETVLVEFMREVSFE